MAMPRSEMTPAIERVEGMIAYVKDNLSLNEYELFLDKVAPLPEPVVALPAVKKRTRKKSASKSARATGMAAAVAASVKRARQSTDGACAFVLESGVACNTGDNNPIHDPAFGYAGYHPFQPAPSATVPLSPSNGAVSSTANTEVEVVNAGAVVGGSGDNG